MPRCTFPYNPNLQGMNIIPTGTEYEVLYVLNTEAFEIKDYTQILDNYQFTHRLGNWAKHFKIKK